MRAGEYTGKESQDFVRGEYFVKTGLAYEGDATWDDQTKRWLVDVSQLAQPETIEFDGEEVTSEVPQGALPSPSPATDTAGPGGGESIGEQFLRGAVLGDFGGEATVASVVGQIAVGFTPLGVAADVRDFAAALKDLKEGKTGAGVNVVLAGIGFLPFGDLAKVLRKSDDLLEAGADAARIVGDVPGNRLHDLAGGIPPHPADPNIPGGAGNYRGRYQAAAESEGLPRLPDDYDVHHSIPQRLRDDPRVSDIDIDSPLETRGVRGYRQPGAGSNVHGHLDQEWARFLREHPNATQGELLEFRNYLDWRFGHTYWENQARVR